MVQSNKLPPPKGGGRMNIIILRTQNYLRTVNPYNNLIIILLFSKDSDQCLSAQVILQCAKKVVSDSPGLVDFAIGLVKSVFNLPNRQVMFFEEFEKQKKYEINSARRKVFGAS